MAASKVLITDLYPKVEKGLTDKNNVKKYEQLIGSYIDRNSEVLSAIGPTKMVLFTDKEMLPVYQICETSPTEVKSIKNKAPDIKSSGQVLNIPFNTLMSMVIRYFTIKKDERLLKLSMLYLSLSMYPSVYTKYFKFEPNENIMNYTINNLSNRFTLKKTGNWLTTIDDTCFGAYELHKNGIISGEDKNIVQFILAIKTRFNNMTRKIANEFYKNHKEGNYLNTELDSKDEDNYHEADSSTYLVNRLTDNVTLKLIVEGPPIKLITAAAKANQVSVNELRNQITTMINNEHKEQIRTVIESILFLFLFDNKNKSEEINSDKFLIYCLDIYKRSNTTDPNIVKIKDILNSWLDELGMYKKTQRLATINNFRKAMYTFFVMSIMYFNT